MEIIIGFLIGGIAVFFSFYQGLKIGQKLQRNEKVKIDRPTSKPKTTKEEKSEKEKFTEGLTNMMAHDGSFEGDKR